MVGVFTSQYSHCWVRQTSWFEHAVLCFLLVLKLHQEVRTPGGEAHEYASESTSFLAKTIHQACGPCLPPECKGNLGACSVQICVKDFLFLTKTSHLNNKFACINDEGPAKASGVADLVGIVGTLLSPTAIANFMKILNLAQFLITDVRQILQGLQLNIQALKYMNRLWVTLLAFLQKTAQPLHSRYECQALIWWPLTRWAIGWLNECKNSKMRLRH